MDTERLGRALDRALQQGVQPFSIGGLINPGAYLAQRLHASHVMADPAVVATVVEALRAEPEFSVFDGGWLSLGTSGFRLELDQVAHWLLTTALRHGKGVAIGWLQEFVEGGNRGILEILGVAGISVEGPVDFTGGVTLMPFSSVPRSDTTDYLARIPATLGFPEPTWVGPQPGACLVVRHPDGVRVALGPPPPGMDHTPEHRVTELLDIVRALAVIGPSAPTPAAHWTQPEHGERVPGWHGSGMGGYIPEIPPREQVVLPMSELPGVVEAYLALSQAMRKRLEIPLERLSLAQKRLAQADRAIELGIALESLLTGEGDPTEQLSYRLRLRGAALGSESLQGRRGIYDLIGRIYALRSQAVHAGALRPKDARNADELLRRGVALCATLIRALMVRASMPDWEELLLAPREPSG